jgi:hypothetical protein
VELDVARVLLSDLDEGHLCLLPIRWRASSAATNTLATRAPASPATGFKQPATAFA